MDDKKLTMLSRSQLLSLGWVALLSPLIRQQPRSAVHIGGRAAWLSPLIALPLLLLYIWLLGAFLKNRRAGEGLQDQFCKALGEGVGRVVLGLYAVWLVFYMGFVLRAGADRFVAAVYPNSRVTVFILVMAGLGLMAGRGRLKALGRCAEALQPLLIFFLSLIIFSSLSMIEPENLFPVTRNELADAARAAPPVANSLLFTVYAVFLANHTEPGRTGRGPLLAAVGTVLLVLLLSVTTIGCFGSELTGAMRHPFFILIRDVRLFNLFERIEAMVIVQWVLTDFVLVALLCHVASSVFCRSFHCGDAARPRWAAAVMALGVAIAFFCAPDSFTLQQISEHLIPRLHFVFLFILLPLVFCIGKLRKKI